MRSHELAVEKREAAHLEPGDEPGESDFRCIGGAAEHALAEEGAAELDSIEAADELPGLPDFDRMRVARRIQSQHGTFDIGVDPCLFPIRARTNHRSKVTVHRNRKITGTKRPPKRSRQVKKV